jgi:hypothetical protein
MACKELLHSRILEIFNEEKTNPQLRGELVGVTACAEVKRQLCHSHRTSSSARGFSSRQRRVTEELR